MKTLFTSLGVTLLCIFCAQQTAIAQTNTFPSTGSAGIGTTTPFASAALEIKSTTQGILVPRMTLAQRNLLPVSSLATGLLIFQTNSTPGFYYYNGSAWAPISAKGANTSLSNLKTTAIDSSLYPAISNSISIGSSSLRWKDVNLYNLKFADASIQTTAFVPYTPGTGITITGNTITNAAPNQTVVLNNGTGISVSGTYPNFTITNSLPNQTVSLASGTGISVTGSYPNFIISNAFTPGWSLTGNAGTNSTTNFIGTTDAQSLVFKVNNQKAGFLTTNGNVFWGLLSGNANTTGYSNVAVGISALFSNTAQSNLVAIGDSSLYHNTTGNSNSAVGSKSLYSNTSGTGNVANGFKSLYLNTGGSYNTSAGYAALFSNTTGNQNEAFGSSALSANTSGNYNTALGANTLESNTTGNGNIAIGVKSLPSNTTGNNNTANGYFALADNTTGYSNIAIGTNALYNNSTQSNLVAVGDSALYNNTGGNLNTAIGSKSLYSNTTGNRNTAIGFQTLYSNYSGSFNTANGFASLASNTTGGGNTANGYFTLGSNSDGSSNVAEGSQALYSNTSGSNNTATGYNALYSNSMGYYNLASGYSALYSNTTGIANSANGDNALYFNITGNDNVADGYEALYNNVSGSGNTAIGTSALNFCTTGNYNTVIGWQTLSHNTTGYNNVAIGVLALLTNTTASNLVAVGDSALYNNGSGQVNSYDAVGNTALGSRTLLYNTVGYNNTASGSTALYSNSSGYNNAAYGVQALHTNIVGLGNTALGVAADVNSGGLQNATAVGYFASATASNQVRIGNGSVSSIGGYANWTNISDGRVKKNIQQNVPGLSFINKLQPVTYNLNLDAADKITQPSVLKDKENKTMPYSPAELNARQAKEQIVYTGFIAQDVEKAAKSLNYDFSGVDAAKNSKDLYGLRYSDFVVPLVKAVQELSRQNDSLKNIVQPLQNQLSEQAQLITDLQKQFNEMKLVQQQCSPCANAAANISSAVITDVTTLEQNVPNPFTHSTSIGYTLPQKFTKAQIVITDKNGKIILTKEVSGSGKGRLNVDATVLSSGAYNYSLLVDGKLMGTKQMVLAK